MVTGPVSHDDPAGWEPTNGPLRMHNFPLEDFLTPGMGHRKQAQVQRPHILGSAAGRGWGGGPLRMASLA